MKVLFLNNTHTARKCCQTMMEVLPDNDESARLGNFISPQLGQYISGESEDLFGGGGLSKQIPETACVVRCIVVLT